MRRWISLVLAIAMFLPAVAAAAEGAMATWLSPQSGQIVSGGKVEVAIGYNTQSKLKVSSLELYVDGRFSSRKILRIPESRGVCSFSWDTTRMEQGTHNLVVKVFAADEMISKVYGTATVGPKGSSRGLMDVRPPVVTFANIKSGDVLKGKTTVKMNAVDDSGEQPMVSLLVDDVLKLLKNTPPYTYDLDTTTYTDGDHALKTYAYDGAGNRSDPAVAKVTFRNGVDRPVVTTLSVNHESAAQIPDENVPPAVSASEPSAKQSAARAESRIDGKSSTVRPVVASPEPKPKPKAVAIAPKPKPVAVAVAPKPAAHSKPVLAAPKLESNLRSVQVSAKPGLRPSHGAPGLDTRMAAAAPKVKEAVIAVPVAKRAAPLLASMPVRMASAASSAQVRNEYAKPAMSATSVAAKPNIMEGPQASGVRTASAKMVSNTKHAPILAPAAVSAAKSAAPKIAEPKRAAAVSVAKTVKPKPVAVASALKPVEPRRALSAPKPSGVTQMAMAPAPVSLREAAREVVPEAAVAATPRVMDEPVSSSLKIEAVKPEIGELNDVRIASAAMSAGISAPPVVVASSALSRAALKRVRVAMAPDLRGATDRSRPSPAIASPPPTQRPTVARIEKRAMPASGKVKARTFFERMGGALFWDQSTHTVTACVGSLVFEMRIGSKIAKVNGHKMTMESAPRLVNDRTVFEAKTFTQACALVESLKTASRAGVHQ